MMAGNADRGKAVETYLSIVTHPLLWLCLALVAGFYFILWASSLKVTTDRAPSRWLKKNYVALILTAVAALAILALSFYLVEIGISVATLVNRLRAEAANPWTAPVDLRNIAYAVAVLVGVLAATTTVFFSSIRVWINERTATATEEGLITDRINKAVEGLGAEKRISRYMRNADGEQLFYRDEAVTPGQQKPIFEELTEPNLEVRIGAIYALERIAQDSDRDHVQIMEILCAYIRQNAPKELAVAFRPEWQKAFAADWNDPDVERPIFGGIRKWAKALDKPRDDVQVALRVIGRRTPAQIKSEGQKDSDGKWQGFKLDLRNTCLQNADMASLDFNNALLDGARLQGADLEGAQLQGANLDEAQLQGAVLFRAQLQGADLEGAQLQGAYFGAAQLQGANLRGARLQGAVLDEAQMDDATSLSAVSLRGAALREVDYTNVNLSDDQIKSIYGDASVILPGGVTPDHPDWPAHFAREVLDWREFNNAWRAWQAEIGFDPDTPDA